MHTPLPLTPQAAAYAWRHLTRRAGLEHDRLEALGMTLVYASPDTVRPDRPAVVVAPCAPQAWDTLVQRSAHSLDWLLPQRVFPPREAAAHTERMPVLLWGQGAADGTRPFAEVRADGCLVFYADILAAAVFLLSRWEETDASAFDAHGRFPMEKSAAARHGFLDRPLVDEYALVLRAWLQHIQPGWQPKRRAFSVRLTHDIDHLRPFVSFSRGLLVLGADVLRRRSLRQAAHTAAQLREQAGALGSTAAARAVGELMELSTRAGLGGTYYFMAARPGRYQGGYDPAHPAARALIRAVQAQGFTLGLHPGYEAFLDPQRLAEEKTRLEAAAGEPLREVRAHFLRFRVPDTWRHFQEAGFTHDSSLGSSSLAGFRASTCHPYRPFDLERDAEMTLVERPLIVMDAALAAGGRTPQAGCALALAMAERCRRVEGDFVLLWHNTSLIEEWTAWSAAYRELILRLADLQAGRA